jgi:hypothetical protein
MQGGRGHALFMGNSRVTNARPGALRFQIEASGFQIQRAGKVLKNYYFFGSVHHRAYALTSKRPYLKKKHSQPIQYPIDS